MIARAQCDGPRLTSFSGHLDVLIELRQLRESYFRGLVACYTPEVVFTWVTSLVKSVSDVTRQVREGLCSLDKSSTVPATLSPLYLPRQHMHGGMTCSHVICGTEGDCFYPACELCFRNSSETVCTVLFPALRAMAAAFCLCICGL